ncbi:hypothetical protein NQ317_004804 [Molorchus minor]|uniref:Rab-like protein 3 n=1 Tax=Molorchus minor TaxID=1323400 RepID=A0ABQ9JAM4_9CUCU|nr:hypothetical protein NQ317_004804 [Molorchus minor]
MSAIDRVKILVLGDSGVGKTSFAHLSAHNEPIKSPSWTVGCSVEVKLHEYKEGTQEQKTFFIEFWDVGGSHIHRNARPVFYHPCHGAILVHDLTNRKSGENLRKWVKEIINIRERRDSSSSLNNSNPSITLTDEWDQESLLGQSKVPFLVIGTKLDQVDERKFQSQANHLNADEIILDCRQARYLAAGTSNSVKLSRFYDKVIENRSKAHKDSFSNGLVIMLSPPYCPQNSIHLTRIKK